MSCGARKQVFRISHQVQHKPTCSLGEKARSLKFRIYAEKGQHYLCSINKGADQLFCTADLRLFFCIAKNLVTRLILSHWTLILITFGSVSMDSFGISYCCLLGALVLLMFFLAKINLLLL